MKRNGFKKGFFVLLSLLFIASYVTAQTDEPADVVFRCVPDTLVVEPGASFELQIAMANTKELAAYAMSVKIDGRGFVYPDRGENQKFVFAGDDGFGEGDEHLWIEAVAITGLLIDISGFNISGMVPGEHPDFLRIKLKAGDTPGKREVRIFTERCMDSSAIPLTSVDSSATLIIKEPDLCPLRGDGNGDGRADIVDALIMAQYYVGLPIIVENIDCLDVNCDGVVDVIDALVLATAYVSGCPIDFSCFD